VHEIKIKGVPGVDVKIHEIETVGTSLPYGTKSGWE
jgi:hypothetical protein